MPRSEAEWAARSDPRHFKVASRALSERARFDAEPSMIGYILYRGGADLEISGDAFRIRFAWNQSRHKYFLDMAPGVLCALLDWCEVEVIETATIARLQARLVPERYVRRVKNPLCNKPATTFRTLGDVWLCSSCSRSFEPTEAVTALVTETTAG